MDRKIAEAKNKKKKERTLAEDFEELRRIAEEEDYNLELAWKKPPQARLSLDTLSLGDEVLADRAETR